ncbi:hypothetical protein [Salana multivorans]|uniref:hypothetical protein n=1 Tax=Salana multivorans TaxID=120377 RepID=UPI00248F8636|nr:hypothetical protein [Salana multivorans]
MLIDILPAGVRQPIYMVYAVLGVVLGSIDIATDAAWVATALAIYAYVGAAVGLVAAANTTPAGRHATPVLDALTTSQRESLSMVAAALPEGDVARYALERLGIHPPRDTLPSSVDPD